MNRLIGRWLVLLGFLAATTPMVAAAPENQEPYLVISLFTEISDVGTSVTSTGVTWKDLSDSARISYDGPTGSSGNRGGRWTTPFEIGLASILNLYSSKGYELVSYSRPTVILRKRQ